MEVYVVTNLDDGWDNVCAVCLSLNSLAHFFKLILELNFDDCETISEFINKLDDTPYYITQIYAQ